MGLCSVFRLPAPIHDPVILPEKGPTLPCSSSGPAAYTGPRIGGYTIFKVHGTFWAHPGDPGGYTVFKVHGTFWVQGVLTLSSRYTAPSGSRGSLHCLQGTQHLLGPGGSLHCLQGTQHLLGPGGSLHCLQGTRHLLGPG